MPFRGCLQSIVTFLGQRSPICKLNPGATITSDTYNRLQEHEIHALVHHPGRLRMKVWWTLFPPLLYEALLPGSVAESSEKPEQEWLELCRFLQDPYTNTTTTTATENRHRRRLSVSESNMELSTLHARLGM